MELLLRVEPDEEGPKEEELAAMASEVRDAIFLL